MSNRRARVEIDQMYKQRVYEISKLNHRRTRSQAISSTGFHAVCGIRYVWIESKPGCVRIGIEECVKIKVVQDIGILQGTEVKIESGRLINAG